MPINPDKLITADDTPSLMPLLTKFAEQYPEPAIRRDVLRGMGINNTFFRTLGLTGNAYQFASVLLAQLMNYIASDEQPEYHPLEIIFSDFHNFPDRINLEDHEKAVCSQYLAIFREKAQIRAARANVVRIETVQGAAIGTGVYLGRGLLLTCHHVFSITEPAQVRYRFGYYPDQYFVKNWNVYEAETPFISTNSDPDHALIKLKTAPVRNGARLFTGIPHSHPQAQIRMMHHPLGKPLIISEPGQILQTDDCFMCHTLPAEQHSSGAPIFNENWELIAIHRGNRFSRPHCTQPNTLEALPINAIMHKLTPHQQP